MSQYTVFVCDRCSKESRQYNFLTIYLDLPAPKGHPTRVDTGCFQLQKFGLCKDCHALLQFWILEEPLPLGFTHEKEKGIWIQKEKK